jgi:hypothetical protein
MKRPSSEKHGEKVESIAGITFHPQSFARMVPASSKRAERLNDNNFHPHFRSGLKAGDRTRTGDVQLGKLLN